jgi:D-3-phosphoglycerate dehydrogenase
VIRILNAEPANYSTEARCILESIGELHERSLAREKLIACLPEFDVLIVRLGFQVDREVIEAGPRLKAIVTATTGLDHIDVDYAEARGTTVLSLKGETEFLHTIPATAEHTWALLLAVVRHIPQAFESVRRGEWNRDAFRGHDLYGRRLGIVGLGRIGEKVAQYGIAFGMWVAAFDPYREGWPSDVLRCTTLADLLAIADVLSLHPPLSSETENMIGTIELGLLPQGAILINTARGALVDEDALVDALESGQLGGAALDVIRHEREETKRFSNRLLAYSRGHANLLITPHIGGATIESMHKTEEFMAHKLARYLAGALSSREV